MSGGKAYVPIVFRGPNGAAAGVAAQHSQCFAAWYGSIPGLKVPLTWERICHVARRLAHARRVPRRHG